MGEVSGAVLRSDHIEDMKRKGVNDPRYIAPVLGEFPKV